MMEKLKRIFRTRASLFLFHLRTEAVRQSNQDLSTGNRFLFSVQIFIKSVFDALGRKGRFPEWHFLMHNSFFSVGRTSNVGAATSGPTARPRRHSFEIRRSKVNECWANHAGISSCWNLPNQKVAKLESAKLQSCQTSSCAIHLLAPSTVKN